MAVECIAVTIAMYCLIQFYIQIKDDISQYSPFLKILSIKLVIFLSFWQSVSAALVPYPSSTMSNLGFRYVLASCSPRERSKPPKR